MGGGCWFVLLLKWKGKKRNEFFSFPFLRTKKINRTVSRPELSLLFFFFFLNLTGPNSVAKFAFLPPNSAGCYQRLNGHEFEEIQGDSERQVSLLCCSSWGCRVGHDIVTEQQQLCRSYNSHFFLWLYATYIPYLLFTLKTLFPL